MSSGMVVTLSKQAQRVFWSQTVISMLSPSAGEAACLGRWAFLDTKEQQDGYDLIEWIANQSWCDGNVGMIGDSYWAWIQSRMLAA